MILSASDVLETKDGSTLFWFSAMRPEVSQYHLRARFRAGFRPKLRISKVGDLFKVIEVRFPQY
jgi:hypothetical protein